MKTTHIVIAAIVVGGGYYLYTRQTKSPGTAAVATTPNIVQRTAAAISGYVSLSTSKVNQTASSVTTVTNAAAASPGTAAIADGPDIESHVGTMA
jgi:hypothetical protein